MTIKLYRTCVADSESGHFQFREKLPSVKCCKYKFRDVELPEVSSKRLIRAMEKVGS